MLWHLWEHITVPRKTIWHCRHRSGKGGKSFTPWETFLRFLLQLRTPGTVPLSPTAHLPNQSSFWPHLSSSFFLMSSSEVSILKPFPLQDEKGKLLSHNCTFLEEFYIYTFTFCSLNFFLHISSEFGFTSWEEFRAYGILDCIYTHDTYWTLPRKKSQEILCLCMGTRLVSSSFTIVNWLSISSFHSGWLHITLLLQ